MRKILASTAVGLAALLTACAERSPQPTAPSSEAVSTYRPTISDRCITSDSVRKLITYLLPGDKGGPAKRLFTSELTHLHAQPPETVDAQSDAVTIASMFIAAYKDGQLTGGKSTTTRSLTLTLINDGVLCLAGLPGIEPGTLDDDGGGQVITPNSPPTVIEPTNGGAGVQVGGGDVPTPVLITVTRIKSDLGPLLTSLDQYPPYFEFHYTPEITFNQPVVVALCLDAPINPPSPGRLRLAHNISPYSPARRSIEIAPLAPAPFLDCNPALRMGVMQRLLNALGPQELSATPFGTSGLAGSVKNFSPFGAVDTLGFFTAISSKNQPGVVGQPINLKVWTHSPRGRNMADVIINYVVTGGSATLSAASAVTDASGFASVNVTPTASGRVTVVATPQYVPGSGFIDRQQTFVIRVP